MYLIVKITENYLYLNLKNIFSRSFQYALENNLCV